MMRQDFKTRFGGSAPILRVADVIRSVKCYVEILGFRNADWGTDDFTCVKRDGAAIYLSRAAQGCAGTWAWIGVDDVQALYEEYTMTGATVRHPPRNYPWALEIHVEDPDGHVLRFGSEPHADGPFDQWID